MNVITRGVRNAFRNNIRTGSIVVILGLSIALALSMLLAHQAVGKKIDNVKGAVGNTISISPAGFRGFNGGGGNPLTQAQIDRVTKINHVSSVSESLSDRLTSSNTNLISSIDAGSLGRRFVTNGGGSGSVSISGNAPYLANFTPPVTVVGTNDPTNLNSAGGGTFSLKSGQVFNGASTDNVALVGTTLATKNSLSVGSTFTAYGATIKVVGIFDAGNTFGSSQLIMPLATVQTLSAQPGDITSATAKVDSIDNLGSTTTAIKNSLGSSADVTNDQTTASDTISSLQNIKSISLYSVIGAMVAGAAIIFLTMLMIVRERRREIGVLKAIGASNLKVIGQFMTEAVTLTVLAAVIGIMIAVVAADPITKTLVNNSNSSSTSTTATRPGGRAGGTVSIGGRSTVGGGNFVARGRGFGRVGSSLTNIHAAVGFSIVIYGLLAALGIAIVGSSIASWTIAKVRPAEVMRSE